MLGETIYTAATAPPCDGVPLDYVMDVSEYGRFHVTAGRRYTLSLCSQSANTRAYITTNTVPVPIACDDDGCGIDQGPSMMSYVAPVTALLRLYVYDGTCGTHYPEGTMMTVSITCEQPDAPPNDLPCGALELPLTDPPTLITDDNSTATNSSLVVPGIGQPACPGYQGADLWYITTVPPSGWIGIRTEEITICAGAMELYTADVCDGSFTALANTCTLVGLTGPASEPALVYDAYAAGLASGDTIYIRYWERNGNENGEFLINVFEVFPVENDEPCGAIPLALSSECEPQIFSDQVATPLASVTAPLVSLGCGGPATNDIWFQFTVPDPLPATGIHVNTSAGTLTNMAMAWYRLGAGTICGPGELEEIGCNNAQSGSDQMPFMHSSGVGALFAGETIYVRLWNETPWIGTFGICASIAPLQENDDPCTAIPLQATYGCVLTPFSNMGATQTGTAPDGTSYVPLPSCANAPIADVWFKTTVPADGALEFDTHAGMLADAGMAVYRVVSGSCAGGGLILEEIACALDGSQQGSAGMPYLSITDQEPGAILYIRVWRESGSDGNFNLCVEQAGPPPGDCYYTLTLNDTGGDGWNGSYVTICIAGICTNYTVYGNTATVDIGANIGQLFTLSYTAIGGPQGQHSYQITQFGQPVYTSSMNPSTGLVYSGVAECVPPPAPWTDCLGAAWICSMAPIMNPPLSYQQDDDLEETNQGCLEDGENSGHWCVIRISGYDPPGALAFHLSPMAGGMDSVNLDFAVWGPYHHFGTGPAGSLTWEGVAGSCPPSGPPIRCSYANTLGVTGLEYDNDLPLTEGSNGSGFVRYLDVQPFEIYLLYVDDRDQTNAQLMIEWITPPPAYEPMGQIDCSGQPEPMSISEAPPSLWSLFPNPSTGQFTITNGGKAGPVELRLIDVGGRLVHRSQLQIAAGGEHMLDFSGSVGPGSYQLHIADGSGSHVQRVIIH